MSDGHSDFVSADSFDPQRLVLLEAWKAFEQEHGAAEDGTNANLDKVQKRMPRVVKKRRVSATYTSLSKFAAQPTVILTPAPECLEEQVANKSKPSSQNLMVPKVTMPSRANVLRGNSQSPMEPRPIIARRRVMSLGVSPVLGPQ